MSEHDFNELQRLEAAATSGPWEVLDSDQGSPHGPEWVIWSPSMETEDDTGWVADPDDGDGGVLNLGNYGKRDAALIVAARNALPSLLALVADLQAEAATDWRALHDTSRASALVRSDLAQRLLERHGFGSAS